MNYTIAHEFDCDADTFWKIFFDEEFQKDMFAVIGIKERTVHKFEEDDREIRREVKVVPKRDLPAAMKTLIKGDFGYVEHDVYHKGQNLMDVRIVPTLMSDRFDMKATFRVIPLGGQRVRREFTGTIKVSVPLLGGKIEKSVVEDMQKSYDDAATVMRRWVAKQQAA
jgi:hypothetical protein